MPRLEWLGVGAGSQMPQVLHAVPEIGDTPDTLFTDMMLPLLLWSLQSLQQGLSIAALGIYKQENCELEG